MGQPYLYYLPQGGTGGRVVFIDVWKGEVPKGAQLVTQQQGVQYQQARNQEYVSAHTSGPGYSAPKANQNVLNNNAKLLSDLQGLTGTFQLNEQQQKDSQYYAQTFESNSTDPSIKNFTPEAKASYVSPEQGLQQSLDKAGFTSYEDFQKVGNANVGPQQGTNTYNVPVAGGFASGTTAPSNAGASFSGTSAGATPAAQNLDTRFILQQGENIDSYNKRVQSYYGTASPSVGYSGVLTGDNLNPPKPINYSTYSPNPSFNISGLNAPTLQATQQEGKISGETQKLRDLNTSALGEATFRAEQGRLQGIPGLVTAQNDLGAKLRGLQGQSQGLQLASQYTIPNQIQEDSMGRGRTTAGVAPLTASALRKNQIQQGSIAFEALTTQAALEATKGNLETANYYVEQAVLEKFGPIKEQIQVAKDNLQLLIDDPETSIEDKNRALAVEAIKDAQDRAISQQQDEMKNILNIAVDAAANGADATTIARINQAKTPAEALQIAAQGGFGAEKQETWSAPYSLGGDLVQSNSLTGEIRTVVNVAAGEDEPSTMGSDLAEAYAAISAGADPVKVRQAFLSDHPSSASSFDSYFKDAGGEISFPEPPKEEKGGLFGWGFLGL